MRLLISGGGTGGHIYPAITIVESIRNLIAARKQEFQVLYVGTDNGLEADIISKIGLDFASVKVSGFKRRFTGENIKIAGQAALSVWNCRKIVQDFQPDISIGTGGFVCGPILLASALLGIPTLIQEQNAFPGLTNRLLARVVDKIAVGYNEAGMYFPGASRCKIKYTGNPVRVSDLRVSRDSAFRDLGLDPERLTVLIAGGSRGARSINEAAVTAASLMAKTTDVQVLHVTGTQEFSRVKEAYDKAGLHGCVHFHLHSYLYNMPQALAVADIVVGRAGAVALAETAICGIPSILIPYPYATGNHQLFNAKTFAQAGAAVMIKDTDLNGEILYRELKNLINRKERRLQMAKEAFELAKPNAAKDIAELAVDLVASKVRRA